MAFRGRCPLPSCVLLLSIHLINCHVNQYSIPRITGLQKSPTTARDANFASLCPIALENKGLRLQGEEQWGIDPVSRSKKLREHQTGQITEKLTNKSQHLCRACLSCKNSREKENLEAAGQRRCTPKRQRLRITADFFIRHHGSKKVREWHLYIAERRKKPFPPRILHPAKISFKSGKKKKKKEKLLRQTIIEGIYCLQAYAVGNVKGNCLVRRNMV